MKDIFRPHASTTRCKGDSSSTDEVSSSSNHHSCSSHRHSNIFRKKRLRVQGIIEESSSLVSFGEAWPPPPMMAVSSSTDTKSIASKCGGGSSRRKGGPLLDRSIPVQVDSADSRNAATPSPHLIHNHNHHHHPSYYKIEIDGTQCQLYAGDDNSVQITPEEHNRNIQATGGPRLRSIDRAVPLASTRSQSPLLMEEEEVIAETSHDHSWAVSDTGAIVKVPNKSVEVAVSPEPQPEQPEQPSVVSFNYSPQKPSSSQYNNYYYSSLPILTKASSDSGSHASSKSSNELLPESPPHVNRSVYEKSLFEESFSRSTSSGKSRSTKAVSGGNEGRGRRSPIIRKVTFSEDMPTNYSRKGGNVKKEEENEGDGMSNKPKRNNACRLDFMSQLWDFVNLTCGSVDCRV